MVVFLQAVTVLKSAIQVAPKQEKILKGTLVLQVFLYLKKWGGGNTGILTRLVSVLVFVK